MAEQEIEQMLGIDLPIPLNVILFLVALILGIWAIKKKRGLKESVKTPFFYVTIATIILIISSLQDIKIIPLIIPSSYLMFATSILILIGSAINVFSRF